MTLPGREITECGISGDKEFETLWTLPNFPLTEAFGPFDPEYPSCNQELVISKSTGHVQLRFQVDPSFLYQTQSYAFRSGDSTKANREHRVLVKFIQNICGERSDIRAFEFGGNDCALANVLSPLFESFVTCDPLLSGIDGQMIDGIAIMGSTVEDAIKSNRLQSINLVLARHTLEHISNPRLMLESLLDHVSDDCLIVIEVPSLECISESLRFDAIFHQHFHYFDLLSLKRLTWELDCEYVDHQYNYQGSNGGSIMYAFRKNRKGSQEVHIDVSEKAMSIKKRVSTFNLQMQTMGWLIDQVSSPMYGFGAGHMLATLNYHLENRLPNLECILDDDPVKDGFSYRNVDVKVRSTANFLPPEQSTFVITSLENIRGIYSRILPLTPKRVFAPLIS